VESFWLSSLPCSDSSIWPRTVNCPLQCYKFKRTHYRKVRRISKEDESLMSEIEAVGGDSFSGLSTLPLIERYFLVCRRLEEVPVTYRPRAEAMIRRVGLESGELEPLAARLADMFAGFVSFFAEWKNQNLADVETVRPEEQREQKA
jgi:hypothetical protein